MLPLSISLTELLKLSKRDSGLSYSHFLAIDTEATGLSIRHGCRAFAVSTCDQDGDTRYWEAPVDPWTRKVQWTARQKREIRQYLTKFSIFVFHNASFDIPVLIDLDPWLEDLFFKDSIKIHDTMILAHLDDSKGPKGLKDRSILHLDIDDDDEKELDSTVKKLHFVAKRLGWDYARKGHPHFPGAKSKFHKMDMWLPKAYADSDSFEGTEEYRTFLKEVCKTYAVLDAVRTAGLFIYYCKTFDRESLPAYRLQQRTLFSLIRMESRGLHLIEGHFERETKEYQVQRDGFLRSLQRLSGNKDLNPDSTDQLKEILFDQFSFIPIKLTKTGEASTDKEALNELLLQKEDVSFQAYRFVKTLLHYRATNSALKYLTSYSHFQLNHSLYPNMNIVGTSTTRLSSREPNGQNVSKGKENEEILDENGNPIIEYSLRRVFGPSKGKVWYAIDYDQLQIRIFAFLSQEQTLIDSINQGFDFHTTVASGIYGIESPTKAQRKTAKYVNFGIIFGAGEKRIYALSGDNTAYRRFTKLYPNVAEYITSKSKEVRQRGFIRTASGYPLTVPRNKAYAGVNYEVQGTEGDIVKLALYLISEYLSEYHPDCYIILQVHDEFIFEAPEDYLFPVDEVCQIMEHCGLVFGVPCKAKPEIIKTNWAEGKSIDRVPITLRKKNVPRKVHLRNHS